MRRWVPAVLAVVALGVARPVSAHQSSIKYVAITLDGTRADVAFKVAPSDVTEPMKLPADSKPTAADAARSPNVPAYVAGWLAVSLPGGVACAPDAATAEADADGFVVVHWRVTCPRAIGALVLDLGRFFAVDKRMEAIVQLGDDANPTVVRVGDSPVTLHAPEASLLRWFRDGLSRFAAGGAHVCFVLALLLVVVLERDPTSWQVRRIVPAARAAAVVIAAFTLAHVVAVIAATAGWLAMPTRLIDALIAASVVYVAADNIARPDASRVAVMIGFGLVHGLGLAAGYAADLPPHGAVPVLAFVGGVELGELTTIAIVLPLVFLLASKLGPDRYRRFAMPVLSSGILVVGTVWLLQRAWGM